MAEIRDGMTRQQKNQIRHQNSGLCSICSKPRINATYCEIHREAYRNRQRKNAWKHKSRAILSRALMLGEIERQGCEKCGEKAEAHHTDYSKPLEVQWLCPKHHRESHGQKSFNPRVFKTNPKYPTPEYMRERYRRLKTETPQTSAISPR